MDKTSISFFKACTRLNDIFLKLFLYINIYFSSNLKIYVAVDLLKKY